MGCPTHANRFLTLGNIDRFLMRSGIEPSFNDKECMTWTEFLRAHWDFMQALNFFTTEIWTSSGLKRYHDFCLQNRSFIIIESVHTNGSTTKPSNPNSNIRIRKIKWFVETDLKPC
jgi:hypothetical protein